MTVLRDVEIRERGYDPFPVVTRCLTGTDFRSFPEGEPSCANSLFYF